MIIDPSKFLDRYNEYLSQNSPLQKYPGATRILGKTHDSRGLDEWRARVGDEEADRILTESQDIGNALDAMVDLYWKGNPIDGYDGAEKRMGIRLFNQILPTLKKVKPLILQAKVWSDSMKVMGYADCIGIVDGRITTIDIKNSKYPKPPEYIQDYWLQTTIYSMCIHDMIGYPVKDVALFIALRFEFCPQILFKKNAQFIPTVLERLNEYYQPV